MTLASEIKKIPSGVNSVVEKVLPKAIFKPRHSTQWAALVFYAISAVITYRESGKAALVPIILACFVHYWGLSCSIGKRPCYTFGWLHLLIFALPLVLFIIAKFFGKTIIKMLATPITALKQSDKVLDVKLDKK